MLAPTDDHHRQNLFRSKLETRTSRIRLPLQPKPHQYFSNSPPTRSLSFLSFLTWLATGGHAVPRPDSCQGKSCLAIPLSSRSQTLTLGSAFPTHSRLARKPHSCVFLLSRAISCFFVWSTKTARFSEKNGSRELLGTSQVYRCALCFPVVGIPGRMAWCHLQSAPDPSWGGCDKLGTHKKAQLQQLTTIAAAL